MVQKTIDANAPGELPRKSPGMSDKVEHPEAVEQNLFSGSCEAAMTKVEQKNRQKMPFLLPPPSENLNDFPSDNNPDATIDDAEIVEEDLTPALETATLERLPETLRPMIESFGKDEPERQSMIALGEIATISGLLPNVFMVSKDADKFYPNLSIIISAPPASGKGVLKHCALFYEQVENQLYAEYKQQIEAGEKPLFRSLVFPANASNAAFIKMLQDNDATGIVFETEIKVLLGMLGNREYGLNRETILAFCEHEDIKLTRYTDNRVVKIHNPRISMLMSGVPGDIMTLLGNDQLSSGLISRLLFYNFKPERKYHSWYEVDNTLTARELLTEPMNNVNSLYSLLRNREEALEMVLSLQQKVQLAAWLAPMVEKPYLLSVLGEDFIQVINRMDKQVARIGMILTLLETYENDKANLSVADRLVVTDRAFQTAMEIAKVLFQHSIFTYGLCKNNSNEVKMKTAKQQLEVMKNDLRLTKRQRLVFELRKYGQPFDRAKFKALAGGAGYYNHRSLNQIWRDMVKDGRLIPTEGSDVLYNLADDVIF